MTGALAARKGGSPIVALHFAQLSGTSSGLPCHRTAGGEGPLA